MNLELAQARIEHHFRHAIENMSRTLRKQISLLLHERKEQALGRSFISRNTSYTSIRCRRDKARCGQSSSRQSAD